MSGSHAYTRDGKQLLTRSVFRRTGGVGRVAHIPRTPNARVIGRRHFGRLHDLGLRRALDVRGGHLERMVEGVPAPNELPLSLLGLSWSTGLRAMYRDSASAPQKGGSIVEALQAALSHLDAALDVLDSTTAPSDIGALVEMAAERLKDVLGDNRSAQIGTDVVATAAK